jgi:peptidoglycan/xylan/chitin deacetylase (PgdA/CDA1 family)
VVPPASQRRVVGVSQAWVPAAPPALPSSLLGVDSTRIPTSARVVALTFDAGANADAIPSILTTLRTKNVRATFLDRSGVPGLPPPRPTKLPWVASSSATYSESHPELTTLSDDQARAEVLNAQRCILLTNGAKRVLLRFPLGATDSRVLGSSTTWDMSEFGGPSVPRVDWEPQWDDRAEGCRPRAGCASAG